MRHVDPSNRGEGAETVDRAIGKLVRPQHGVASRAQLRALSIPDHAIDYRLMIGRLQLLHRGVYAVGHRAPSQYARLLAAVLACGEGAVLGGLSAAELWGLVKTTTTRQIVVVTPRRVRPRPGIRACHAVVLADERTRQFGIPVTTPARTLLDLARAVDTQPLSRAIRQAEVLGLVKHHALVALADSGRRGASALRDALTLAPTPTRSTLEDTVVDWLQQRPGTPAFRTNARVAGCEVDVFFPEHRLVVELDSEKYHDTPQALVEDALKRAHLEAAGYTVVRVPVPDPSR